MKRRNQIHQSQSGFTIVELMIATVISTVLLLVITFGVVHFTNDYYKGVNSSNTQATAQNAIDVITQAVQFNASGTVATNGTQGIFCAGTQVFLYTLGKQLTGTPSSSNWGLYQLNNPSSNCVTPGSTAGGTELLSKYMRLTSINLSQIGATNVWNLDMRVAYGDSDLLCRPAPSIPVGSQGNCQSGPAFATAATVSGNDVTCKITTGSQFCTVTDLTTAIGQRITN
jgi:prepilin-type N-terminal cleavage/methylation domain-containing protein